jgi:hypothetical protein
MRTAPVSTNRGVIEAQCCEAPASSAWLGQRGAKGTPVSQGCRVRGSDSEGRKWVSSLETRAFLQDEPRFAGGGIS